MVIGSDSPTLALYSDGLLVFWEGKGYRSVQLDREETEAFLDEVDIDALACAKRGYTASNGTDQPTTVIIFGRGGGLSAVGIYGSMKSKAVRAALPPSVVTAYDRLKGYRNSSARPWMPARVEVMIWPYEYAPEASIHWPEAWPTPSSEGSRKRGDGYSLFLPAQDYDALIALLKTRREKGAVEIAGKKWAVSVRLPFPAEERWMGRDPR